MRAVAVLGAGVLEETSAAPVDGLDFEGLDFEGLLGAVTPFGRPWLQRTVRAAGSAVRDWLRAVPARAAGWGAGPAGAWCAW